MPMNKEKVPQRLLTQEQLDWTKQFKKAKQVAQFAQREAIGMGRLFEEATGILQQLMGRLPEKTIVELAQQPEEEM